MRTFFSCCNYIFLYNMFYEKQLLCIESFIFWKYNMLSGAHGG